MDQSNCDDLEQVSSTPNGIDVRRECSRDPVDTIRDTKDQKERQNVEIAISEQENVQQSHHQNGSSACFIDASSLLDENEIGGGEMVELPQPIVPNPSAVDIPFSEIFPRRLSEKSASSSSSGSLNNLSDEEKLLKREIKKTFSDIKDQYSCDGVELRRKTYPAPVAGTPSLNDRRLAELERKQGELIFKNNIQQFSSHLMNNPSIDIYDTQPRKFSNSSEKSYFLPDTPHNSIVHVDNSSSNSLNSPKLFRKSKCDESSPIISGGINTKFESSSSSIDEIQRDLSSASSSKNSKSHNQSWVVDMSHSGPASARPRSSSTSGNESISSIERKSNMGMGFYVSLHDMDTSPKSLDSTITFNNFKKDKKSTEFYIDFSDTSREGTPKMARKKPSFIQKKSEEKEDVKPKEAEEVTMRKSSSVEKDSVKRHTWGSDSGEMKILDKISLISKVSNSSNSLDDSTYTKSVNLYGGATFDKNSSADSLTDALLSSSTKKSTSSTEETEDLTFQDDNEDKSPAAKPPQHFSRFPGIMETIIESKESSSPKKIKHHTMETLQATMEKQLQLLENGTENGCCTFVKLSDMDKPSSQTKFELHSPEMSKSTGNRQINRIFFDSRSNRPHSWAMTRSTGNNIMNITSSMDNLKSITRLFPHLSKELSNSLPNYIPFGNSPTPPYCIDLSMESSSLTSSFSRSAMDESSMSCRQPRRLGEDLLKMFIQELATDVAIEVNGRLIKAHKCILRSRCQYFAAMLAGDWNDGNNALALPGFSYSSVHFALCHIYSGASHPPEGISLMELAALADLLGLEGLKEVTSHALKVNYCHNFHKPCSGCIDGILQVLPVALNHALDDLYRKCLKWTCKYYMKVWPTRHFAQLPEDIFKRCRQQIVAYMTSESVLETILDCDSLLSQLATYRWAVVVENLTRDILEAAYNYISEHFANVIASDYFLSLGHDKSKYIMHLENIILHTAATLCPDQACRSYQRITRLNAVLAAKVITFPSNPEELLNCVANGEMKHLHLKFEDIDKAQQDWHEDFIRLVSAILSAVEQCLIRQCSRAMRGMSWQRMDVDLRKKIQTLARLNDPLEFRRTSAASSSSGGKPVAKAFSFGGSSSRTQNLIQVKLAMQASKKTIHTQTNDYENHNRVTNNYNNTSNYHVGHGTTGENFTEIFASSSFISISNTMLFPQNCYQQALIFID
ncbi:KIAA1107 family protein [Megaselia abdita]